MMMKKIFYTLWIIFFAFTLFTLVCGKIKPLGRFFLVEDKQYGDLFRESKLDDFAEYIQRYEGEEKDSPFSADIICFGDSFFEAGRDINVFADLLEERLDLPVYNSSNSDFTSSDNSPLSFFTMYDYTQTREKLLILEVVERYTLAYSSNYWKTGYSRTKQIIRSVRDAVFNNSDVEYFFQENFIIYPVNKAIKNCKYRYFDEVEPRVYPFSRNPRMLFFYEGTEFSRRKKTDREIQSLCNSLVFLSSRLQSRYNINLLYIIIPNKYSLYGNLVHKDYVYDQFIPEVNEKLREKGIDTIDVYKIFTEYMAANNDEILYYPNDTHFKPVAVQLLLDAVVDYIRSQHRYLLEKR
jgi:hypothetical protein